MTTQTFTDGVSLTAASWFNDVDTAAYAALTSVSGTNTIAATGPANFSFSSRMPLWFIPANTNTGATTLNVTPSGSAATGAKNVFAYGAACAGGEIVQNVPCGVIYDGTQYNIISPIGARVVNVLSGDVDLNNTANFFTGPTCAQGTAGTWLAMGHVTLLDTAGAASFFAKLWDGTTVIASGFSTSSTTNAGTVIHLAGVLASPAGNIRIDARDTTATSGKIKADSSGGAKDSMLTVIRIR